VGASPSMNEEILGKIYKYCAYQDRCRKEVTDKLMELGLDPDQLPSMLKHLQEERFWDEERYARSFARGKFNIKRWGRQKIRFELKAKKVPDHLITLAIMEEIEEDDYLQTLSYLIEKKSKEISGSNSFDKRGKLLRYMLQKGYEKGLIFKSMEEI